MNYHKPVLLHQCIELLNINPAGIYVDVTFGGGGHSQELLKHLETGHLYAFDQDPDAETNAPEDDHFTLIKANFRYLKKMLRIHGVSKINGLLADFGISSHQIDQPERGFSLRHEGPLDMRMNPSLELTAAKVVNEYSIQQLSQIFHDFGELRQAHRLASEIERGRPIHSTAELREVLASHAPKQKPARFWAQVFQAIRIEVNQELEVIHELLEQTADLLVPGGRMVCLSYHSLEDRPVKNFFRYGNVEGKPQKDFYGNLLRPLTPITKKPITANAEELKDNSRARSAKLRVAEKIEETE